MKIEYEHDGRALDAVLLDAIARGKAGARDFEDFRANVVARVRTYTIFTDAHGERAFGAFEDFARFLSIEKIDYVFVFDAVHDFSFLDWELRRCGYPRNVRADNVGENGGYKKVTGNAFAELSGELGQRYSLTIWTKARRTRAERGDRHERTHGTDFYGLKNFFPRSFADVARSFGVEGKGARALRDVVYAFDAVCEELTGVPFLGKRKPLAMTAGGLAKRELLRAMYGSENPRENVRAFRKAHPLNNAQDEYMRLRKLNRGGVCYLNPACVNVPLEGVKKYDVSSEYTAVAVDMPDLGVAEICDIEELFKPLPDYEYIAIFGEIHATARKGFPAIWQNPETGNNPRTLHIYTEQAFFWREIESLRRFYKFQDSTINRAIRVKKGHNAGYESFGRKFYKVKEDARADGRTAYGEFAKLMLNSAWGKLAERNDYPDAVHVFDEALGAFKVETYPRPKGDALAPCGGLSIIQGAYVMMRGRVLVADYILKICGDASPLDSYVYTDTDSVASFADAPHDVVRKGLGYMKLETTARWAKFVDKKAYVTTDDDGVDIHVRGVPASAIIERVCDEWGVDSVAEIPPVAWLDALDEELKYDCPLLANVQGGRAPLYVGRRITEKATGKRTDGVRFSRAGSFLVEI